MTIAAAKKFYSVLIFALCITMLALPAFAIEKGASHSEIIKVTPTKNDSEAFRVLMTETGEVEKISRRDYLFGVVASEMGPESPLEALKAQTVACYTYALYRKGENADKKYDISDSPDTDQKYVSRSALIEKWGSNADKYSAVLDTAIEQTLNYVMTDSEGKPILAAYHAVSSGRTESAQTVWGSDYPYLQSVESIGDLLSPDYLSVRTFTQGEISEAMSKFVTLSGDASKWLGGGEYSESGTVISYKFGDTDVSGADIRDTLGLRSAAFDVSYKDDTFTFNVKGFGHGVGMSQYGAKYLASTGSNFVEILSHYYTGCRMSKGK